MDDCVFCKIIKGEIPSAKVYEDEKVLAFMDIQPVNKGHALVIPKGHFANIYEAPDEVLSDLIRTAKKVSQALKKSLGAEGVNVTINNEPASGQVIFHIHLHVIPRWKDDGHGSWSTKKYEEGEREELARKISGRFLA